MRTEAEREKIIVELFGIINDYADIICYEEDYFKEDVIHDSIARGMDILEGDKKGKLTSKDIFNGWVKDYFDQRYEAYSTNKEPVSYISDFDEEKIGGYTIDNVIDYVVLVSDLKNAMNNCLSKREQYVLCSFYGLDNKTKKSMITLSKELGCSTTRAKQIKRKAVERLRLNADKLLYEYYK